MKPNQTEGAEPGTERPRRQPIFTPRLLAIYLAIGLPIFVVSFLSGFQAGLEILLVWALGLGYMYLEIKVMRR